MSRNRRAVYIPLLLVSCVAAAAFGAAMASDWSLHTQHLGWWAVALLLGAGAALGWPALVLPFIGCIAWYIAGSGQDNCAYECGGGYVVLYIFPFMFSVPVVVGATLRTGVRAVLRRRPHSAANQ